MLCTSLHVYVAFSCSSVYVIQLVSSVCDEQQCIAHHSTGWAPHDCPALLAPHCVFRNKSDHKLHTKLVCLLLSQPSSTVESVVSTVPAFLTDRSAKATSGSPMYSQNVHGYAQSRARPFSIDCCPVYAFLTHRPLVLVAAAHKHDW